MMKCVPSFLPHKSEALTTQLLKVQLLAIFNGAKFAKFPKASGSQTLTCMKIIEGFKEQMALSLDFSFSNSWGGAQYLPF